MRDAVRNKECWEKAPYAYPRSWYLHSRCADGRWRMYFEARGESETPTVICSAVRPALGRLQLEAAGGSGARGPSACACACACCALAEQRRRRATRAAPQRRCS